MDRLELRIRTDLNRFDGFRPRLELALPACMLWSAADAMRRHPEAEPGVKAFANAVCPLLYAAYQEPFIGLSDRKHLSALGLMDDINQWIMKGYATRPAASVFMIALRWLESLIESGALELIKGSAADMALDRILAELQAHEDIAATVDRSATRESERLDAKLQGLGLYRDAGRAVA